MTTETGKTNGGIKQAAISWLTGQPVYIVLLVLVLSANGYMLYWSVTRGVPQALQQIQTGYEKLDLRHREERQELRGDAKQAREEAKQTFQQLDGTIRENTRAVDRLSERIDAK